MQKFQGLIHSLLKPHKSCPALLQALFEAPYIQPPLEDFLDLTNDKLKGDTA